MANARRLVSKQELFETVWPNVTVCDDSLVQCIRELRQKLGDDDRRLIKTVSRRGYLLDVTVSEQAQPSLSHGSAATPAEGPRKPATKLDILHLTLTTIVAHKLSMWGAAAAFKCVALSVRYLLGWTRTSARSPEGIEKAPDRHSWSAERERRATSGIGPKRPSSASARDGSYRVISCRGLGTRAESDRQRPSSDMSGLPASTCRHALCFR